MDQKMQSHLIFFMPKPVQNYNSRFYIMRNVILTPEKYEPK